MPNFYYIFGLFVCLIVLFFAWCLCRISAMSDDRWAKKDIEYLDDGFGNCFSPYCPECRRKTMQIIRPGKVQCGNCG